MSETPTADVLSFFAPAVKEKLHALVAIDGPTGTGKTWTGLQAARILAGPDGKVGFVDTENRTALHYAAAPGEKPQRVNYWDEPYVFEHMSWAPPYNPGKLARMIEAAQDHFDVLVIDSVTHFWSGEGGTLDVVDDAASRAGGNTFAGWKTGSPMQRNLLDVLIHAHCHIIITMRSKMEYVLEEVVIPGRNGAKDRIVKQPKKIGLAPEQRAGIEYEFNVVADMDLEHKLTISKTRCSLLADAVAPKGRSAEIWQKYAAWLDTGVEMPEESEIETFVGVLDQIEHEPTRLLLKTHVKETWGLPRHMTRAQLREAAAWVIATLQLNLEALQAASAAEPPAQNELSGAQDAPGSTNSSSEQSEDSDAGAAHSDEPQSDAPEHAQLAHGHRPPEATMGDTAGKDEAVRAATERAAAAGREAVEKQNKRAQAARAARTSKSA